MQELEWRCPFHPGDVLVYVNILSDCDQSERILCKECVSEKYGGLMQNLKQLQDVLKEIKQQGDQFQNIKKSKDKFSQQINRIQSKLNGLFGSRSYLSIEIGQNSNLSVLRQSIHSYYCQSDQNVVKSIQKDFKQLQEETQKAFDYTNEVNTQLREIQTRQIENNFNGPIKYIDLDTKDNISNFQQIKTNFEEKNILIIQNQAVKILCLEDNKLIEKNVINIREDSIITYVIKEIGNSKIIIGQSNGYFEIWEQISNGKYIKSHEQKDHNSQINLLSLCYNNKILITGSKTGINCWQYNDKYYKWIKLWGNNIQQINYLCVNLDDKLLAAVINQKTLFIFKLYQNQQCIEDFQQSFDKEIIAVCFMNDDDFAIFFKSSRKIEIYQYKQNTLQFYQDITLKYIITDCMEKLLPKFYKDIGLLSLKTDQELILIKQKNLQQKKEIKR
ncbi:unnamed protein product [Paramecium primaurelia]|uniref:WD40-repeat-containing domain n=1 Tax=Paramecium primaurelia TaxID=5886 RepID=A0A8S1PUG7_PARPR|nr:unnamed protein product [Paramecium primaurelia]